jgi:Reverse transcriptase (RNA-dependent DNA polymerase)
MYDPTIHARTLARQFEGADFVAIPNLLLPDYRAEVLEAAAKIGASGFPSISLIKNTLRGKPVYGLGSIEELLVLRHITANIRRVTGVRQDDRHFIVSCIKSLTEEGVSFRLYKFDIEAFYESVSPTTILDMLEGDVAFSGQSVRALRSFFNELDKANVPGLPRGLAISATLAEYLMRGFDTAVSNLGGILYYSRFVDDICLITDGTEDEQELARLLSAKLPAGLSFNDKSKAYRFGPFAKIKINSREHTFDYLGYQFTVSKAFRPGGDDPIHRQVRLDISPAKVRKIKTKIAASLMQFRKDGIYEDLQARLRILTGNFDFKDRRNGVRRVAGIYYNYRLVDGENSSALVELDRFLRNALMSPHPKNTLRPAVPPVALKNLVKNSFRGGFEKRHFFHFSAVRLAVLSRCWSYV